jgi:chromate transporter
MCGATGEDGEPMTSIDAAGAPRAASIPSFAELVAAFARIGVLSFGGAAGQIAMMHRIVVDERGWLDEKRFLHALNYCMLLPGPEAQQLATYVGWLTHGVRGGLAAGVLFVLPGALLMLALSVVYTLGTGLALVDGVFYGVKAAVLAIVAQALIKIARRGLRAGPLYALAAASFLSIVLLDAPFPLIVLAAGALGAAAALRRPDLVGLGAAAREAPTPVYVGQARDALVAAAWCLAAWWSPIALAALALGGGHVLVDIGLFFSQLAVLTFGGAYAVLAWLTQAAVEMRWVTQGEMIDGLGLAETTPGPTILVNQFVAFLAALRDPGGLDPWLAATLGSAMAVWATFAPSFLWIFAGAPFVETLRRERRLAGALAGITAAVVGVIAWITLWFGLNVLFGEVGFARAGPLRLPVVAPESLDPVALALSAAAFGLLFGLGRSVMVTVGALAALGVAARLAGGG